MTKTRLYNMNKQEWREGNFERGDNWRSDIAYQCEICHTKTNKWIMGGWPGMGPRIYCPGWLYQEHDGLEASLGQYQILNRQIQEFEKMLKKYPQVDRKKAQNIVDNLYIQRELFKANVDELRKAFFGRLDNVVGLDSSSGIENFYSSSSCIGKKKKNLN